LLFGLLAGCRQPGPGSVSGQVKFLSPDGGGVSNLAGAQVILRGARDTYTTVSSAGDGAGDQADASYNYRFEKVPAGQYTMAVTPPPDSHLQPEDNITLNVKGDELYPQSVLLLAEGVARPRPLSPSEVNAGEVGYVNGRGERVVYQQGSGLGTDLLLMYLLFRNPPAYGYGAPPIIAGGPSSGTGTAPYRVETPPSTTSSGQRVTYQPPSVPGQGSTRPGGAFSSGSSPSSGSTGVTSPSGSSQGVSRPSYSPPAVSAPSGGRTGGFSSGGRK